MGPHIDGPGDTTTGNDGVVRVTMGTVSPGGTIAGSGALLSPDGGGVGGGGNGAAVSTGTGGCVIGGGGGAGGNGSVPGTLESAGGVV